MSDNKMAFPLAPPAGYIQYGMTLRDWFAGQALQGLLAGSPDADCGPSGYAKDAYLYADAMIAARSLDSEEPKA